MAKEFTLNFEQTLQNGLRRDDRSRINSPGFVELINLKPSPFGLAVPTELSNSFSNFSQAVSWPFPQIFRGRNITLIAEETTLRSVNESTTATTVITTWNATDNTSQLALTSGGGAWQFTEIGDSWFLTNIENIVIFVPQNGTKVVTASDKVINTISKIGETLLWGGVTAASFFASQDWTDIFNAWKIYLDEHGMRGVYIDEDLAADTSFVFYGTNAGAGTNWPLVLELALMGYPTSAQHARIQETLLDRIRSGEMGMLPLDTQGPVYRIEEIGNSAIAFCADAVVRLDFSGGNLVQSALNTIGVGSRTAAGGSVKKLAYVDNKDFLWTISSGLESSREGFEEFMDNLTIASTLVVHDEENDEFHISDGTAATGASSFILTSAGLSQTARNVTSIIHSGSVTSAFSSAPDFGAVSLDGDGATIADGDFLGVTEAIDFGINGQKQITSIQLTAVGVSNLSAALDYNYDNSDTFTRTAFVSANDENIVWLLLPGNTATKFRIVVRGTPTIAAKMEQISVKWQAVDLKGQRGLRQDIGTL